MARKRIYDDECDGWDSIFLSFTFVISTGRLEIDFRPQVFILARFVSLNFSTPRLFVFIFMGIGSSVCFIYST